MKQLLLAVSLATLAMSANANSRSPIMPNLQAQGQIQGQIQGQAQFTNQANRMSTKQSAALHAQASQIVNLNESRRPVNAISIPGAYSMNDCMGSTSAGFGNRIFNLGGASTWTNETCQKMKVAKELDIAGMHEDALFIRCSVPMLVTAPSCITLRDAVEAVE